MSNNVINILQLEDSANDSELIQSMIIDSEIKAKFFLTDNEKDFYDILENEKIDLILSDFNLPDFNGNDALKLVREKYYNIPFIFISGAMGEVRAIQALLNGATDYVLKNNLDRLVPAIRRAISESDINNKRILAENDLRSSERKYENLVNEVNDGYFVTDIDGKITFANQSLTKMLGFLDAEELIGHTFSEFNQSNNSNYFSFTINHLIFNKKKVEDFELEFRNMSENIIFITIKVVPIIEDEIVIGMQGVIQDITLRKLAENSLINKNQQIEEQNQKYIEINKELAYQNDEKENRAQELIIANEELAYQNVEKEHRANELNIANIELAYQNEEKEKRANELNIANKELVYQNDEKEKRAIELVIAKDKAEESNELKTAFIQNMTHEIRTPLNGIIGFAGMLRKEDLSKEDIADFTAMITESGNRLIELIDNVMEIAKIQTKQVKIEKNPIIVNSVLYELFQFFSPLANANSILLYYKNENDEEITINTDEIKLNKILTNLLKNAIKFTKNGSIDFGFEINDNLIQFYVKDTGMGIPSELHEKIFDRFMQADNSISRSFEGAGLGLSICKGLVELLGGTIKVESEVDIGTTFSFTLPYP